MPPKPAADAKAKAKRKANDKTQTATFTFDESTEEKKKGRIDRTPAEKVLIMEKWEEYQKRHGASGTQKHFCQNIVIEGVTGMQDLRVLALVRTVRCLL